MSMIENPSQPPVPDRRNTSSEGTEGLPITRAATGIAANRPDPAKTGGPPSGECTIPHRVVLADREPVFLLGLKEILQSLPGIECSGLANDSRELRDAIVRLRPTLVVLGFVLGCGRDVLGLQRDLRAMSPGLAQVVLLPPDFEWVRPRFVEFGIHGLVPRTAGTDMITRVIETVAGGGRLDGHGGPRRGPRADSTVAAGNFARLTDREREIFRLFARKMTYKEIASTLGISTRTVDAHRQNIKVKLNASSARALRTFSDAYAAWESTGLNHLA